MLKVKWFDTVSEEVSEAVAHLPEAEFCPHDVYLRLLQIQQDQPMQIALVSDEKGPIAVSGIVRQGTLVCEPVSNWLYAGQGAPGVKAGLVDAYAALNRDVRVIWWDEPAPNGSCVRDVDVVPSYRMNDLTQREEYWRKTGYKRKIRLARERTAHFEVRVGDPSFAAPITAGWRMKWKGRGSDDPAVQMRTLMADALEPIGRHVTIALLDNGAFAAGCTLHHFRNALILYLLYVPDEYREVNAGIRLIDLIFEEAEKRGIPIVDLGPGGEYKLKWAPQADEAGQQVGFSVIRPATRLARDMVWAAKDFGRQLRRLPHRSAPQ